MGDPLTTPTDEVVGKAIATARHAQRLTQDQLAAEAIISVSLLRKIERGVRPATPRVLQSIADALDVDPSQLTGTIGTTDSRIHQSIPLIRHALDSHDLPNDGPIRPLDELARAVATAERHRLGSHYARLARDLPDLLEELHRAVHTHIGTERERASEMLTSAYRSADAVVYKFGYHDLSARIIELMRRSADQAANDLLQAAVAYVRTETYFATGNLTIALRALQLAADQTPPRRGDAAAACGALHMRAAVVAGRSGDPETARSHLAEARKLAARVHEGTYNGTAFGPDSVHIHQMAVAVELGRSSDVLTLASRWSPPNTMPAERRSHYYVDLARAQLWAGQRNAALNSLLTARQVAPQHVREHPQVRDTVATLLRISRSCPDSLLGLASWTGVT